MMQFKCLSFGEHPSCAWLQYWVQALLVEITVEYSREVVCLKVRFLPNESDFSLSL